MQVRFTTCANAARASGFMRSQSTGVRRRRRADVRRDSGRVNAAIGAAASVEMRLGFSQGQRLRSLLASHCWCASAFNRNNRVRSTSRSCRRACESSGRLKERTVSFREARLSRAVVNLAKAFPVQCRMWPVWHAEPPMRPISWSAKAKETAVRASIRPGADSCFAAVAQT